MKQVGLRVARRVGAEEVARDNRFLLEAPAVLERDCVELQSLAFRWLVVVHLARMLEELRDQSDRHLF